MTTWPTSSSPPTRKPARFVPGWRVGRHLCTDPQQYGHANVHGAPGQAPTPGQQTAEDEAAEAARKTEERRRVRHRNTAWRAATETRTAHLKALLARKAPPAGALKLIVAAMARGETQPQMSSFGHQTACELLGLSGNGAATGHRDLLLAELARASEKRAQVIALAMVLGAAEHGIRDVHTWQSAENRYWASYGVPLAARYLAWLAEHTGYALSDIEAEVAAHATSRAASGPSEPAGEAKPGAAQPDDDGEPVTGPGESEPERDSAGQDQTQAPTETS
jgi:ParB family chromosome partitioning protein